MKDIKKKVVSEETIETEKPQGSAYWRDRLAPIQVLEVQYATEVTTLKAKMAENETEQGKLLNDEILNREGSGTINEKIDEYQNAYGNIYCKLKVVEVAKKQLPEMQKQFNLKYHEARHAEIPQEMGELAEQFNARLSALAYQVKALNIEGENKILSEYVKKADELIKENIRSCGVLGVQAMGLSRLSVSLRLDPLTDFCLDLIRKDISAR